MLAGVLCILGAVLKEGAANLARIIRTVIAMTAQLHGVDELRAALRRTAQEIELQAALLLLEAGTAVRDAVAAEAPVREGHLRDSIQRGPVEGQPGGAFAVRVYEDDRTRTEAGVGYGVFVQEGTRPHVIRPRRGQALKFVGKQGTVFAKVVNHPGTKPNDFWGRGFARAEPQIYARAERFMTAIRQRWRQ